MWVDADNSPGKNSPAHLKRGEENVNSHFFSIPCRDNYDHSSRPLPVVVGVWLGPSSSKLSASRILYCGHAESYLSCLEPPCISDSTQTDLYHQTACILAYVYKHLHTFTYTHVHTHSHIRMCTHIHTSTCANTHIRANTCAHTLTKTCAHALTHILSHTLVEKHRTEAGGRSTGRLTWRTFGLTPAVCADELPSPLTRFSCFFILPYLLSDRSL